MRNKLLLATVGLLGYCTSMPAQWTGTNPEVLNAPPAGVIVGTGGGATSALTVRGDQMSTPTGEVFRTDAPNVTTNWRLLRDGTEYGRIYNFANSTSLNIGAPEGAVRLYTESVERFRLYGNSSINIGTFTGQQKNGHLLLGPNLTQYINSYGGPGAYSLLHLAAAVGDNAPNLVYRPWMGPGMSVTGNADLGYFGMKYAENDHTQMVLGWGNDIPGTYGPDQLSVRFLATYNSTYSDGGRSVEGAEAMLFHPADYDNVNVGVGDFRAASATPEERLDVLTGKVRIRRLPFDPVSTSTEFVTVNATTGVLEHRPMTTLPDNCEWTFNLCRVSRGTRGPCYS